MEVIEPDMMMREERAKQFAPFDAMKGLQEALRDREERHSRFEKREISEEQIAENAEIFCKLIKGSLVRIECYKAFHDIAVTGTVTEINITYKYLKMGSVKFLFEDIYTIEILDMP